MTLLERLLAARGPDRDLDREIAVLVGLGPKRPKHPDDGEWKPNLGGQTSYGYDDPETATGWIRWPDADRYSPPPAYHPCKRYTENLNHIISLIQKKIADSGLQMSVEFELKRGNEPPCQAVIWPNSTADMVHQEGWTLPLALCAALVSALEENRL